jgi:hypothetical protein
MNHPWGNPNNIAIAQIFTRELIKSVDAIATKFQLSIPELTNSKSGRKRLYDELYSQAKAYEVDGYSPEVDIIYIMRKFMEASKCDQSNIELCFDDGIFN